MQKIIKKSLLHLDIEGHDDRSTKLSSGLKRCYDGQWPLTSRYFKRWFNVFIRRKRHWFAKFSHRHVLESLEKTIIALLWRGYFYETTYEYETRNYHYQSSSWPGGRSSQSWTAGQLCMILVHWSLAFSQFYCIGKVLFLHFHCQKFNSLFAIECW